MSFSSDIKQELNKNSNLSNKDIVKQELVGYLLSGNINIINNKEIRFSTESDYNINRFSKLLSNLDINHSIDIIGKIFVISLKIKDIKDKIKNIDTFIIENETQIYIKEVPKNQEERKAIIRGTFMGAGSINNPESEYHLEIELLNVENMKEVINLLLEFGIETKNMKTKNKYYIYLKDGEKISKFLALIGAGKAVMKFEDVRIQKEMRGKVNRLVNCETANLNKTINASIEQISAIKKLQKTGKFKKLDDNLKEIAILRLENPNMSLIELGKKLKNPLGKSGVNYRLKKIMEIANGE